jgi:hypothetical protein
MGRGEGGAQGKGKARCWVWRSGTAVGGRDAWLDDGSARHLPGRQLCCRDAGGLGGGTAAEGGAMQQGNGERRLEATRGSGNGGRGRLEGCRATATVVFAVAAGVRGKARAGYMRGKERLSGTEGAARV